MTEVLRFALLGLGLGALYALASQGLMVIYRGSGVLNFAHGAIGAVGAYVHWETKVQAGAPAWAAWLVALATCAVLGALVHIVVMRNLQRASPLARTVATLGILVVLQSAAVLRYGAKVTAVPTELPRDPITIGEVVVTADRVLLALIAAAISVLLWAAYRFSRFGLATTAVAENQRAAKALGLSPDVIATANWAIGSVLAGAAAILIAPIVQLQVNTITSLVLAAMAAALVAGFRSFPIAFGAGILMGIGQSELIHFTEDPAIASSLPFGVIVVWLVLRGQSLPLRDFFLQRLPAVGSGRVRARLVVSAVVGTIVVILVVPLTWQDAFVTTFSIGLVLLSVVVLTGYAGQLSLGQFALAGFGALVAGRLLDGASWPLPLALLAGVACAIPIGVAFAIPALRTRGINLTILTFGLGTAMQLLVFNNSAVNGGYSGTLIGKPTIFGIDINAINRPDRYAIFSLLLYTLVALMVANIRRGRSGRRLLAVRTNERAAAALGINVAEAKVYAFGLSAGIAALGGILIAFRKDVVLFNSEFTNFTSILVVAYAFVGGVGFLLGPIFGSTLAPGSLGTQLTNLLFADAVQYITLAGGVMLVVLVLMNQDGIAKESISQLEFVRRQVRRARRAAPVRKPAPATVLPPESRQRAEPKRLEVRGLTVRYGGTEAVSRADLVVEPGKITGLIGPNGAGKTSVIDAITGFTSAAEGSVHLDGHDITRYSATKRARAGLSRSFQSLELFEDSTVLDNLRAAYDPRDRRSYLRDLIWPSNPPMPGSVVAAIREFGLETSLDKVVQELSYGERRLLAIARAVATGPTTLLLDEPAAGLGEAESAELAHLVRRLASEWGIGILLVEHDMEFVMGVCDRIVVLNFGRRIAEGQPAEVRANPRVVEAYLGEPSDLDLPPERERLLDHDGAVR